MLICSDGWASYNGLTGLGFNHRVVIHNTHFVNPESYVTPDGQEVKFYKFIIIIIRYILLIIDPCPHLDCRKCMKSIKAAPTT